MKGYSVAVVSALFTLPVLTAVQNRTKAISPGPKRPSCAVSKWSAWSVCSATCGPESYKYKRRTLLGGANNKTSTSTIASAMVCRKQLERKRRCHVPPCLCEFAAARHHAVPACVCIVAFCYLFYLVILPSFIRSCSKQSNNLLFKN